MVGWFQLRPVVDDAPRNVIEVVKLTDLSLRAFETGRRSFELRRQPGYVRFSGGSM